MYVLVVMKILRAIPYMVWQSYRAYELTLAINWQSLKAFQFTLAIKNGMTDEVTWMFVANQII